MGPGVFNFDTRQHWKLKNNEWKYDPIPQFYDGKNIADFYQPNIDKQLNELENEEKEQMNIDDGDGDGDGDDEVHQLNDDDKLLSSYILRKHNLMKNSLDDLGINIRKVSKTVKTEDDKKKESLFNRRGRPRFRTIDSNTLKTNNNESGLDFQEISRLQSRSKSKSRRTRTPSKIVSKGISSTKAS